MYPRPDGLPAGLVESFALRVPGAPRVDVYALDLLTAANGSPLPQGLRPEGALVHGYVGNQRKSMS